MTGAEFRARRLALGLSVSQMARAMGVTAISIQHWQAGRRRITLRTQQQLEQLERERERARAVQAGNEAEAQQPPIVEPHIIRGE